MEDCDSSKNILTKDNNYNEKAFQIILNGNKGMELMAIPQYRYILLQQRSIENENYNMSKDNFERLFLENLTEGQYKRLLKRMEYNGWTTKELFKAVIRTGARVDRMSAGKFNN